MSEKTRPTESEVEEPQADAETQQAPEAEEEQAVEEQGLSRIEVEHYAAIREASIKVGAFLVTWEGHKSDASMSKKRYDSAVEALCEFIDDGPTAQRKLPGTGAADGDGDGGNNDGDGGDGCLEVNEHFISDAWRDLSVADLSIPGAAATNLADGGLDTIGRLIDKMKKDATYWAKDVTGIGPAKQTVIEDAVPQFFKDHPEYRQEPEAEEDAAELLADDDAGPTDPCVPEFPPAA